MHVVKVDVQTIETECAVHVTNEHLNTFSTV